jgi:hypothetical protein
MVTMKIFIRRLRPSPSMAVALVALLVALGGSSYAALKLPARSVGTKQIKPKAVGRAHIKDNAVVSATVANDSLTGSDIVESSLGQVPSATGADHAAGADHAGAADHAAALDIVNYRTTTGAVPPAPSDTENGSAVASAFCDAGQRAAGGGVKLDNATATAIVDSYPDFGGTVWTAHVDNSDIAAAHGFTVYAVCVPAAGAG